MKLTPEEEAQVAARGRESEYSVTVRVLAARAGEPPDLQRIGARTKLKYWTDDWQGRAYLNVNYTNHQGAHVGKREEPILDDGEAAARLRLDRRVAKDLGALMFNRDD